MAKSNPATVDQNTGEIVESTPLVNQSGGQLSVKQNIGAWVTTLDLSTYEKLKAAAAEIDPKATAIAITAIYKEFAVGESVVGIFTGLDGISPRDEITQQVVHCNSVQWMGIDGKLYQCAGVALVNQFFDQDENGFLSAKFAPGTKIRITHTGKSNRTKLYEVELFAE